METGASYDGGWSEDKMSGAGTYMYPESETGYKLEGHFQRVNQTENVHIIFLVQKVIKQIGQKESV